MTSEMVQVTGNLMSIAERNVVLFMLIIMILGLTAMGVILVRFTSRQIAMAKDEQAISRKAHQDYIEDLRKQIDNAHATLKEERLLSRENHEKTTQVLHQITESIRELHNKISRMELVGNYQK
ncbi:MAG: hypothetical protein ACRCX2_15650 [Paraclostridium sp.]